MRSDCVPLVSAAARLRLSYRATMDAVLRGDLVGFQDHRRRWFVDRRDLQRLARERARMRSVEHSTGDYADDKENARP